MSDLSPEQRAELRRLHEAATQGPWSAPGKVGYVYSDECVTARCGDFSAKDSVEFCGARWNADAALIAAMRNAIPALLDMADEAEALRELRQGPHKLGRLVDDRRMVVEENTRLLRLLAGTTTALECIANSANDLLNEMVANPSKQGNWGGLAAHVQISRKVLEEVRAQMEAANG